MREERRVCRNIKLDRPEVLSAREKQKLQFQSIAIGRLADILRDKGDPECLTLNEDAIHLYRIIDDKVGPPIRLFNLGHVFKNIAELRDLDKAAMYYTASYESYPELDHLARAQCLGQLGAVSIARVEGGSKSGLGRAQMLKHLNRGIEYYEAALEMFPPDATINLAITHNQMGAALRFSKTEQSKALSHFKQAIRLFDQAQEWLEAATTRVNAAQMLAPPSRKHEALEFVNEAIKIFEFIGYDGAHLAHAKRLIAKLNSAAKKKKG